LTSLYGAAADSMQRHQQATRNLFNTAFGHGETGEAMLTGFRIKKFDPSHENPSLTQFNQSVAQMRDSLAAAKAVTSDAWVLKRIGMLDKDAELMKHIYGVLNEAAGYKADSNNARKEKMRALIEQVNDNEIAAKEDFRYGVLKSLMPHVNSVLGAAEAAKYDRVAVVQPE
jgi:hypothetical protein